jgi:hypothetical protein
MQAGVPVHVFIVVAQHLDEALTSETTCIAISGAQLVASLAFLLVRWYCMICAGIA